MAEQSCSPTSSAKRPYSDSEEGSGESDLSQNVRLSSESPISVPLRTSDWNAEDVCNRLQITLISQDDPRSLFVRGYLRFFRGDYQIIQYMRTHYESPDQEYKIKQACLEFALCTWKDIIDCQIINDANAIKMHTELNKSFEESSFKDVLEEEKYTEMLKVASPSPEEKKKMSFIRDTCLIIFEKLRLFSFQLLYLISNNQNPSERMFQNLFLAFVRIFDLKICDTTNSPGSCFKFCHGTDVTLSEPDALISTFMLSTSKKVEHVEGKIIANVEEHVECKVIAVVEVKKCYSTQKEDEPAGKKMKLRNTTKSNQPVAEYVNPKTKGQHIGEMLAVTQSSSSVFGKDGIFGFIVQGTKVTFVSLEANKEYFDNLLIKDKTKSQRSVVSYSKECNILSKEGRHELIPIFLGMEKLLHEMHNRWIS